MSIPRMDMLIDFDGTIVFHDHPRINKEVPNAIRVLQRIMDADHNMILHTCRNEAETFDAMKWLYEHDVFFDHVNKNPRFETGSRKIYGHFSIDDHNLGCPLIHDTTIHPKPFVDWLAIEKILEEKGLI